METSSDQLNLDDPEVSAVPAAAQTAILSGSAAARQAWLDQARPGSTISDANGQAGGSAPVELAMPPSPIDRRGVRSRMRGSARWR